MRYYHYQIENIKKRLKKIRKGNLDENCEIYNNFKSDKLTLKEHQKTMLFKMIELESGKNIYLDNENNDKSLYLSTKLGFCCDRVGSGKSLVILALLEEFPELVSENIFLKYSTKFNRYSNHDSSYLNFCPNGITLFLNKNSVTYIKSNVIVVPHSIVKQWEQYITKYTHLTYYTINKKKKILTDYENIIKEYNKYNIILCSSSMYNLFVKELDYISNKIMWNRVIFDEADSLNIPACKDIMGKFVWFITSSLENIFFSDGIWEWNNNDQNKEIIMIEGIRKTGYLKDMIKNLMINGYVDKVILKNNDEYVLKSFNLPDINYFYVDCKDPDNIRILDGVVSNEIINLLNGGNVQAAIQKLGCKMGDKNDIIEIAGKSIETQYLNILKEIDYKKSLIFTQDIQTKNNEIQIKNLEKRSKILNQRLDKLKNKIKNNDNRICCICYENPSHLTITNCCKNTFCFNCITYCLHFSNSKSCPMCREKCNSDNLLVVSETKKKNKKKKELLDKIDQIFEMVTELLLDKEKKIIIFAEHDSSLKKIEELFIINKINFSKICGTSSSISKKIKNYKEGNLNLLLLNSNHFAAGINLENTSDIIIYHKMSEDMETQLIGRAYRPGIKNDLNVHYLVYKNERIIIEKRNKLKKKKKKKNKKK